MARPPAPDTAPELLNDFITKAGLGQKAFAKHVDVGPSTLSEYISRAARPKHDVRARIARATGGAVPEAAWETAEERKALAEMKPFSARAAGGAR